MRAKLRNWVNAGGFCVAATYALVVLVVFVVTASTTTRYKAGYDWIPLILLATPWYRLGPRFLMPGLIANAFLLYVFGTVLETLWNRIVKR